MPKYEVRWVKTYVARGIKEIHASSEREAREIADAEMASYTGSMDLWDASSSITGVIRLSDEPDNGGRDGKWGMEVQLCRRG